MSTVAITSTRHSLDDAFAQVMELAGLAGIVGRGKTVLVKPNQHGGNGYTSPLVIAAAARWAFSRGAGEVWVGDGPFWSMDDAMPYFRESGLLGACEETGAKPLNFHQGEYRVIEPGVPELPPTIGFSEYLYQADVVINLPLMKTHFNTLVTLGTKNLKGCLRPIDKKTFHDIELNEALAEVNRLLKPVITATVMDATTAMEGMGPAAATPVQMGLLIASSDVVAADSVGCHLMGIDPTQARLIRFCTERGVGVMDLTKMNLVGERIEDHKRRFRLPFEALAEDFPELRLVTEHACSGCMLNLFRAMEIARHHGQEIKYDTLVIGPGVTSEGEVLLVGQCTKAGWEGSPYVRGCPPRVEAIREGLTGIGTRDDVPQS